MSIVGKTFFCDPYEYSEQGFLIKVIKKDAKTIYTEILDGKGNSKMNFTPKQWETYISDGRVKTIVEETLLQDKRGK